MTPEQERGKRIHDERVRRGWSQEHLARMIDVSSSHLSKIELGKAGRTMEKQTAAAIAAAFEWAVSRVRYGTDVPSSVDQDAEDLWAVKTRIAVLHAKGTGRLQELTAALQAAIDQAEHDEKTESAEVTKKRRGPR